VFDLSSLERKIFRRKPLLERKRLLKEMLPRTNVLRYSEHLKGEGSAPASSRGDRRSCR
jgi:ATP-dependent DNA ligase